MIDREEVYKKAWKLGMIGGSRRVGLDDMFWSIPIRYVIWWFDGAVYILLNTPSTITLEARVAKAKAKFTEPDELEAAFATYHLMNAGG